MKSCNHPTCESFCRKKKEPKKRKPIAKRSKKRVVVDQLYYAKAKEWRSERPLCELRIEGVCTGKSQGVHHLKGRSSIELLVDERFWKSSCNRCNLWVEMNSKQAFEMGYKLSKYKRA